MNNPGSKESVIPCSASAAPTRKQSRSYESLALAVIFIGLMMTGVDTTAVVLALPVMITDLNSDILTMVWVIMSYLLVLTISGTQVGRLGDIFGRVRMFNLGFLVFVFGSLLCGLSQNGPEIIAFRVVQGIGGALVYSNSGAIIADTVSERERGRAYGLTGIGYPVGAILGILAGGIIITFLNWRYIFFINLPIGIVAVIAGYLLLKERSLRIGRKLDFLGMALLGMALLVILYAVNDVAGVGFSNSTLLELLGGSLLILAFVFWERRFSAPLLDLSLLRERVFTASVFASFFQGLANFAVLFLVIMYLQGVRGLSPFAASILLIPGYLIGGAIGPFAGSISDKHGARGIASLGLGLQAVGILVYASLAVNSPTWIVVIGSVIGGTGSGLFFPANSSAVMAAAPPRAYGVASGLLRTLANAGMVSSFAVALLMASISIPRQDAFAIFLGVSQLTQSLSGAFVTGMRTALLTSISLLVVSLILSILRGKEARADRSQ